MTPDELLKAAPTTLTPEWRVVRAALNVFDEWLGNPYWLELHTAEAFENALTAAFPAGEFARWVEGLK